MKWTSDTTVYPEPVEDKVLSGTITVGSGGIDTPERGMCGWHSSRACHPCSPLALCTLFLVPLANMDGSLSPVDPLGTCPREKEPSERKGLVGSGRSLASWYRVPLARGATCPKTCCRAEVVREAGPGRPEVR